MSDGCFYHRHPTREAAVSAMNRIMGPKKRKRMTPGAYEVVFCLECNAWHLLPSDPNANTGVQG